jgi:hypothetical protein
MHVASGHDLNSKNGNAALNASTRKLHPPMLRLLPREDRSCTIVTPSNRPIQTCSLACHPAHTLHSSYPSVCNSKPADLLATLQTLCTLFIHLCAIAILRICVLPSPASHSACADCTMFMLLYCDCCRLTEDAIQYWQHTVFIAQ